MSYYGYSLTHFLYDMIYLTYRYKTQVKHLDKDIRTKTKTLRTKTKTPKVKD
jgi:hypothetical protein